MPNLTLSIPALFVLASAAPLAAATLAPATLITPTPSASVPLVAVSCIRPDGGRERHCEEPERSENRDRRLSEREEALRERGAHDINDTNGDRRVRRVNRALEDLRSIFD